MAKGYTLKQLLLTHVVISAGSLVFWRMGNGVSLFRGGNGTEVGSFAKVAEA